MLPPQSRIGCTGKVSQHRPSPHCNPAPPAQAGAWRWCPRGVPSPAPCAPRSTPVHGGREGPAPGSRAGVSDAAVGRDAAAGLGELGTAARGSGRLWLLREPDTKQTLLRHRGRSRGDPGLRGAGTLSWDAGQGGLEMGSPGAGWAAGSWCGGVTALPLAEALWLAGPAQLSPACG